MKKVFNAHPIVLGDAIQLQQVLINLFNNATEAIEHSNAARREIKLSLLADHEFASISVEDTGGGIDTSMLANMFELYKTTKKNGLGVGLWLSKTIIDKHRGNINAANSVHGGAVFTIHIPLAHSTRP